MLRRLALVPLAVLVFAAPAGAAWTRPAGFDAGADSRSGFEPVPRAGIAADGTSAVAWMTQRRRLVVSTGDAQGRFSAPRVVDATGTSGWSVAAAPGGAALVAWEDRSGAIFAAVRRRGGRRIAVHRVATATGSPINDVQVAADPRGGWVLAERQFPRRGSALPYSVRAVSLDAGGRAVGEVQDLGLGFFGIDARPTAALAVDAAGRAVLAFTRERSSPNETAQPVVVSTRPHGGRFTTPAEIPSRGPSLADPRVAVGAGGRAIVAVTHAPRCGDSGCFGAPALSSLAPDGAPGADAGPTFVHPNRAFAPFPAFTGIRPVIVFQLKDAPAAFSREAPVRAVPFGADGAPGEVQTLSSASATEPVALGLAGGRALAVWAGRRGWGAALAGPGGRFVTTPAPVGPPPEPFHSNPTNRDVRAAGRWAIVAWSRGGRVRISVRRF